MIKNELLQLEAVYLNDLQNDSYMKGNTVRFGLVGTGRITDWVLNGARQDPRFEAAAICSRSREKAEAFAACHGIPKAYDRLEDLLADPDIDAVYIGTPNHTHEPITLQCLAAGKHVLCEKPLALNAAQGRRMVAAARKAGKVLMEAMISTLNPNWRNVCARVNEIAPLRRYAASFCQYSSKYEALKQGTVAASFDPLCGGGALMDIGIYTLWPMVALLGKPREVHAHLVTCRIPGREQFALTDLQGSVECVYPGLNATAAWSKIADAFAPTELSGEGGNLLLDKLHICRHVGFIPHGAPASGRGKDPAPTDITIPDDADEYFYEFQEFITCVQEGRESRINTPDRSVDVLEIMDEIRRQGGIVFPADLA